MINPRHKTRVIPCVTFLTMSTKKEKIFTTQEEIKLCTAWISKSEDPIIGTNQTGPDFWKSIASLFNESVGQGRPERSSDSLAVKFRAINRACNKFLGNLQKAEALNGSGKVFEDFVSDALQLYESLEKSQFKFQGCFNVLKDHPKWNVSTPTEKNVSKRSSSSISSELDNTGSVSECSEAPCRPVGTKKAKQMAQQEKETLRQEMLLISKEKTNVMKEAAENALISEKKRFDLDKERLDLDKERSDLEKNKFILQLLTTDTTKIDENALKMLDKLKADILNQ